MTKKYTPKYAFSLVLKGAKKWLIEALPLVPGGKPLAISVAVKNDYPIFSSIKDREIMLDLAYQWLHRNDKQHSISKFESANSVVFTVESYDKTNNGSNTEHSSCCASFSRALLSDIGAFLERIGFKPIRQDTRQYKPWGKLPEQVTYTAFRIPGSDKVLAEPSNKGCSEFLFNNSEEYEQSVIDGKFLPSGFAMKLRHQKNKDGVLAPSPKVWALICEAKRKGLLK